MRNPAVLLPVLGVIIFALSAVPYLIFPRGEFFWLGGFLGLFLVCMGAAVLSWQGQAQPLPRLRR